MMGGSILWEREGLLVRGEHGAQSVKVKFCDVE